MTLNLLWTAVLLTAWRAASARQHSGAASDGKGIEAAPQAKGACTGRTSHERGSIPAAAPEYAQAQCGTQQPTRQAMKRT